MARPFKLLDTSQGRPRLDRYELIAELAAGGMATVYLARLGGAGGFQRFVAIKRLHPHLAHEPEFVQMFLDEARIAASIHHPNVVPILEVGESPAGYYLVMEYIEGDTLQNLRLAAEGAQGRLPPGFALRVVHDALLGLHAAHELRDEGGSPIHLVHRDISPQNILIGVDGTSRVTDFGVARASTRLSSTRSGEIKGKMAYMAPEQVRAGELDRRSDLFAMGIVLWETLAGKPLFLGPNEVVTMHRVLNEPIPALLSVAPGIPKRLSTVVARALERDPAQRFSTGLEFADAIEAATRDILPMPSAREVADALRDLIGPKIAERKEAISRWMASLPPNSSDAWSSLSISRVPQALSSNAGSLSGISRSHEFTPSSTSLPAALDPASTASSLSPLFSGPHPSSFPPSPTPAAQPASPAAQPPRWRRAAFVLAPLSLLLVASVVWVATRSPASAPTAPPSAAVSAPPVAASAPAPEASSSHPRPASSAPEPPPAPSSLPGATSATSAASARAPRPTKVAPPPDGLDKSPYR